MICNAEAKQTMTKPIVHLICQAHLDPVWMWAWEEGAREAISTFNTAAQLLDEFPEFVFNHNESLLYEWIEEYDPRLFERIQGLVKARRWNITGGWYLQPDLNLLGGETVVRLILEGRRYFDEKFGVRPAISYNFDTFGHPGTLPQILKGSGFEMYIHCRPVPSQMDLPSALYCWRGIDGSEVITLRPNAGWYCTPGEGVAQKQARNGIEIARQTGMDVFVPWGLGDHGGGATRKDLLAFREMLAEFENSDIELKHSTPEAYLERIRQQAPELPSQDGELQRTLMGCYTSVAPIKRQMREGEALLASAERWAAIAWWRFGWKYPVQELREAWKRLMFNTFHDVLCGSLVEDAIPGVDDMYGYAHDVARRVIVRSQHALLPNVKPTPETIPLYVFNPHSSPMHGYVGLNFLSHHYPPPQKRPFALFDDTGKEVVRQTDGGSTIFQQGTWQPYVGFCAEMPPLSTRRYEIRFQEATAAPVNKLRVEETNRGIIVDNTWWEMQFSKRAAAPTRLIHRESGRNLLKYEIGLWAMEDVGHAWGGENRVVYNRPVSPLLPLKRGQVGDFAGVEGQKAPPLRIIESGPVSISVEALVKWQHTRASIRYTLYADLPYIDVNVRLYMQARRKMIKLSLPFDLPETHATVEVPYGSAERPADGTEFPYARWIRLDSPGISVGVANNGQNGFDVSADGVLNLSISRGAVHCSWEGDPGSHPPDPTKPYTFMDQGQIDTGFRIVAGDNIHEPLVAAALDLNQPLERFFIYSPPSTPEQQEITVPFLSIEPSTVVLGALKKAEREDSLIIRLVETAGTAVTATATLENGTPQTIDFNPYEIKSLKIGRDGQWRACNLIEE
jgi:alpha-mannosidase